jgi:hypothetical protein
MALSADNVCYLESGGFLAKIWIPKIATKNPQTIETDRLGVFN